MPILLNSNDTPRVGFNFIWEDSKMNLYFHRYPHLVVEKISEEDDSIMVFDSNLHKFFSMNSTAGTILLNCEGKKFDEIAALVSDRYDLPADRRHEVYTELWVFISDMIKNEILYTNSSQSIIHA